MEAILPGLLAFPPSATEGLTSEDFHRGITAQIRSIKELQDKTILLVHDEAENIFVMLDPAVNTVPFAIALCANLGNPATAATIVCEGFIWNQLLLFLRSFDPIQIRYLGQEFTSIIEATAELAKQSQQSVLAVGPIRDALLRLDSSGSTFTTSHLLLARLALESQQYAAVTPVLDLPKLYFPGMQTKALPELLCTPDLPSHRWLTLESGFSQPLKYADTLEYFLFSGVIYIGLRNWAKAAEALEVVVTYPSKQHAVSKIMVEAYKKWVLVNLLLNGEAAPTPSTTNSAAARAYRTLAKPYDAVASLFDSAGAARFKSEVDCGQTIWNADNNAGLIAEVLAAYQKFRIRKLARIYSSISVSEVTDMTESAEIGASLPSDDDTESLILSMINEGGLSATVTRPPGSSAPVLTFDFNSSNLSEAQVQKQLALSLQRVTRLTNEIKDTDRRLTLTQEYTKWTQTQKKQGKLDGGDDSFLGGPLDAIEDEDLMSGML